MSMCQKLLPQSQLQIIVALRSDIAAMSLNAAFMYYWNGSDNALTQGTVAWQWTCCSFLMGDLIYESAIVKAVRVLRYERGSGTAGLRVLRKKGIYHHRQQLTVKHPM